MTKTILILEKSPVVSMDLYEAVSDAAPGAAIHLSRSLRDALRLLDTLGLVDIAFIGSTRADPAGPAALNALVRRAGRVVFTEDAAREGPVPQAAWFVVPRPFGPRRIMEHLLAVSGAAGLQPGAAGAACHPS